MLPWSAGLSRTGVCGATVTGVVRLRRWPEAPEGGSVMVQPDRQQRQPGAQPEPPHSVPARYKALARARDRFDGSLARSFLARLKALDFAGQAMLFGAGLL